MGTAAESCRPAIRGESVVRRTLVAVNDVDNQDHRFVRLLFIGLGAKIWHLQYRTRSSVCERDGDSLQAL